MFTVFPILYPAGVAVGAQPVLLAGALLSGALFGDNLAPISDTTVISASSRRYRRRNGLAEVGGVVRARAPYSLSAALVAAVLFYLAGMGAGNLFGGSTHAAAAAAGDPSPRGLVMLVPVLVLLIVAFVKRDLFLTALIGLVTGTLVALAAGLMSVKDVLSVTDGKPTGFLVSGVSGMLPLILLAVVIFAMIGVLQSAGVFDDVVALMTRSNPGKSPVRAEFMIAAGAVLTTSAFAGVNGSSMIFFGQFADRIGADVGLHPYRRANIMDCFTLGLGVIFPVASSFLLIASTLTQGYPGIPSVSAPSIFTTAFYPLCLTLVMVAAILTGWGRRYEGPNGAPTRSLTR
ncbi:Na+/H+ antiporter NhaC family protein [Streptomyces sp. NPDC007901]|uniref:Na+/H+ antiporter NhaC family protein n=1 Tax=Streptomyces sp. NPDC007901 TaxID=3364785 RepID=UPI0036E53B37